jgi:hypothetical protein
MSERRKHSRYDVSGVGNFVGKSSYVVIEQREVSLKLDLKTISEGGCGFYSTPEDESHLKLGDRLTFNFGFQDNRCPPVVVKGDVVSITPETHNDKPEFFYAIRFLKAHQQAIEPLLDHLDELVASLNKRAG